MMQLLFTLRPLRRKALPPLLGQLKAQFHRYLEVARPQPFTGLSNFNSVTMSIDAQVSPKITLKIWANEFVEFRLLINPRVGDARYQLAINQNDISVPTLSLEPSSRIKPIYT